MTPGLVVSLLGWACYAGAALAIAAYVAHFAGRQGWKRPWNAAGLFFTSIALSQTPFLFQYAADPHGMRIAFLVTVCLLASACVQAFTALRQRRGGPGDAGPAGSSPEERR